MPDFFYLRAPSNEKEGALLFNLRAPSFSFEGALLFI